MVGGRQRHGGDETSQLVGDERPEYAGVDDCEAVGRQDVVDTQVANRVVGEIGGVQSRIPCVDCVGAVLGVGGLGRAGARRCRTWT